MQDSKPRCGSPLRKKPGKFCQDTALFPNGKCRRHGGKAAKGIAHPNFRHGGYSIYMPKRLKERSHNALQDPTLLELGNEVALVQTLLGERIEKIYAGETEDFWEYVTELFGQLEAAIDAGDAREVNKLRTMIRNGLARGLLTYNAFEALQPLIEQKSKLTEKENKRLKDLQATLTVQQVLGIVRLLGSIVKRHILDPKLLAAISEDLDKAITIEGTIVED